MSMPAADSAPVGLIGGTGVYDPGRLFGFVPTGSKVVDTPYGSVPLTAGELGGRLLWFLNRHGPGHQVPPHRVNYRANLWALWQEGVRAVLATAAVGSLESALTPGTLVLLDQFLDFTGPRARTFFDGAGAPLPGVRHTDMTAPYCAGWRSVLMAAADHDGIKLAPSGTYVCTEGPRFETAAEIRAYHRLGGSVVGMTGVPEVVLARELGLCYATVCLVTNLGAGLASGPLTHDDVTRVVAAQQEEMTRLLSHALPEGGRSACFCPPAPDNLTGGGGA